MANTVTIDERDGEVILHVKYGESIYADCHTRQLVDSLNKELESWRKKASALEGERDELKSLLENHPSNINNELASQLAEALNEREEFKAKYEDAAKQVDTLEGEVNTLKAKLATPRIDCFKCTHKERLSAAEQCIDQIMNELQKAVAGDSIGNVNNAKKIIRAYRKKKGGEK